MKLYMTGEPLKNFSATREFSKGYTILLLLVVIVFVNLPYSILIRLWVEDGRAKNDFVVFTFLPVLVLYLMILCPIVLIRTKPRLAAFDCIWFRWTRSELIMFSLLVLGMILIILIIAVGKFYHILPLRKKADYLPWNFPSILFLIWMLIRTTLISPVVEEVFWRGYVQSTLVRTFRPWIAIPGQALFFGLLHFSNPISCPVNATLIALLFGVWCYKRKTLLPVIIIHIVNNLVAITIG